MRRTTSSGARISTSRPIARARLALRWSSLKLSGLVELDAVAAEAHHRRRGVELRHETRRVAGGAARQLALLDEDGVRPTGPGEVIGDARAGDPTADDNDPRPLHAIETYAT